MGKEKPILYHKYTGKEYLRGVLLLALYGISWQVPVPIWLWFPTVLVLAYVRYMYQTRTCSFDKELKVPIKYVFQNLVFAGSIAVAFFCTFVLFGSKMCLYGVIVTQVWGMLGLVIVLIDLFKPHFFDKRYGKWTEIRFKKKDKTDKPEQT